MSFSQIKHNKLATVFAKITDYLNIDRTLFDRTGALDAILNVDTKLYISPLQLHHTEALQLQKSYGRVVEHFQQILTILVKSKKKDDIFWRTAERRLKFKEPEWLSLGYSSSGNHGRGIGVTLQKQLITSAKDIIDAGTVEPEIFELIGLFEENVGPDLISDMVASIIFPDLLSYSTATYASLELPLSRLKRFSNSDADYYLPSYVVKNEVKPIILVPRDILKPLPIMATWDDIDSVIAVNKGVRDATNKLVGGAWSKAATSRKKEALKHVLLSDKELFTGLIEQYKHAPPENYDFLDDPAGFLKWLETAKHYTEKYPVALPKADEWTQRTALALVLTICGQFKRLVEDNGLSKELYNEKTQKPRHEETSQKLFFAVADSYCRANNLDLTRESDAGRGPVDFKFSSGYDIRVLVETKLNKNSQLLKGYDKQLEIYKSAERTQLAIYMVLIVSPNTTSLESLEKHVAEIKKGDASAPHLFVIDGLVKPSASKVR